MPGNLGRRRGVSYEDGDRVYLFGFSRGAYTARVVAGFVERFGIPHPEHVNIIPHLWQHLTETKDFDDGTFDFFRRLKSAFGRPTEIEFMGLWDTVSAFGLGKLRTVPQTAKLAAARFVRHAVAIDERRNMFPENPGAGSSRRRRSARRRVPTARWGSMRRLCPGLHDHLLIVAGQRGAVESAVDLPTGKAGGVEQ